MRKPTEPLRRYGVPITIVLLLATPPAAMAQLTVEDYARAERLLGWNARTLVTGAEVDPRWLPGDAFWYRVRVADGHEFVRVDIERRERRLAFDHERLAAALSTAADTTYEPLRLPFREFEYADDGTSIRFTLRDSLRWECNISEHTCAGPESITTPETKETVSPDGRWAAFARDENLWIRDLRSGEEIRLSDDGEADYGYAAYPEGCCSTITDRREGAAHYPVLLWSPDSRKIATHRLDERGVERLHLIETAEGRPRLHSYRYALPGDSVVPRFELYVFDVASRGKVRVDAEPQMMDFDPFAEDSVWLAAQWSRGGDRLFFTHMRRGQKGVALMVADAETGVTRTILEEASATLVELNLQILAVPNWRVVGDGREVIWFSERDGWGHLYLYDAETGELRRRITSGPWVVVDLLHVDPAERRIYFTAAGREPGRDIYHRHLYRADLDRGAPTLLTPEDADHDITVTPSGRYFVDTYGRRGTIPLTVVRDLDGRTIQTVEEADISRLRDAGWRPPRHFVVKARDDSTDLHGFLYLPSTLDPDSSYPLIDYIYPGPQTGPIGWRGFRPDPRGNPHALAELGFIVMQLDAMGTPFRSKAFHDRWYGDMGDNGIPDHIAAIRQLAARYPQIDTARVGIFGHSGGGFSSTDAILRYPDFFKVAVSSAGNHDNRSYYYTWGERYQGLLEETDDGSDVESSGGEVSGDPGAADNYESQANQNLAEKLEGKLLLMYGTLDDNVHPNATLLLIDELIEHNKDFDLIVLPNRNHGYSNEPYVVRRTWDYFVRHLRGLEPPREYVLSPPPESR